MTDPLPDAVIYDMDGTLCDTTQFLHHITGSSKDFYAFHDAACRLGKPNQHVVNMLHCDNFNELTIIIVTGRSAKWHEATHKWLADWSLPYHELHGRADGDYRPDTVIKAEILAELRKRFTIVKAVDDRPSVLATWREQGIPEVIDADTWEGPDK